MAPSVVLFKGESIAISDKTVHMGHAMCTKGREDITLATINKFWKNFNLFITNFGQSYSFMKIDYKA